MTTRRSPGEGSVYQRIDGRWEASLSVGYSSEGKRRRRKVVAGSKREVSARLAKLKSEIEGLVVDDARMTVAEWLHRWLTEEATTAVRPRTLLVYEVIIRCHLDPVLGHIPLQKLTPPEVKAYLSQKIAAGLAAQTVRSQHAVLRRALEIAFRYGYVARNVARLVSAPRVERAEIHPLDKDETRRFLDAVQGHRLEALFVLAASTGMREGEVLGLTWACVDLDGGFVRVEKTLARYGLGYHLDPPKTRQSRRAIAIPAAVADALRAHRATRQAYQFTLESAWIGNDWDLVFTNEVGTPLSASTLQQIFKRLLASTGIREVRFHDLRHGAATFLLAQGVAMKVVQEMLGHAQMSMTADLYSHVVPELRRDAADRIAETLFSGRPQAPAVAPGTSHADREPRDGTAECDHLAQSYVAVAPPMAPSLPVANIRIG